MITKIENDKSTFYEHDDKIYFTSSKTEGKLLELADIVIQLKEDTNKKISEVNNGVECESTKMTDINSKLDNIINYLSLPWYKKLFTKFKA